MMVHSDCVNDLLLFIGHCDIYFLAIYPFTCMLINDKSDSTYLVYLMFDPELQIRGGIEDNSKIIFLISQRNMLRPINIFCDPTLEPSLWKIVPKLYPGLPQSGKNVWKMKFFPGQGKVREFCGWPGKFRKDLESQGI